MKTLITSLMCAAITYANAQDASSFAQICADKATSPMASIKGSAEGWLFLPKELKHVGLGEFWSEWQASAAKKDPAEFIADYHNDLKAMGVDLIVVPVPAKATIYPEKLATDPQGVPSASPYLAQLEEKGVQVLDLEPLFKKAAAENQIYCASDTHWNSLGAKLAAEAVFNKLGDHEALKTGEKQEIVVGEPKEFEIKGDLAVDELESLPKEKITLYPAGKKDGTPVESDSQSPVILLGDSHTLVFSDGADMHSKGAGFRDHLAAHMGFPAALEANRGSGTNSARRTLIMTGKNDPDFWNNKKLVIWLFSVREFTQESGWRKLPPKL